MTTKQKKWCRRVIGPPTAQERGHGWMRVDSTFVPRRLLRFPGRRRFCVSMPTHYCPSCAARRDRQTRPESDSPSEECRRCVQREEDDLMTAEQSHDRRLVCEWRPCHGRHRVTLVRATPDSDPVAVCPLHRKSVLGVSS